MAISFVMAIDLLQASDFRPGTPMPQVGVFSLLDVDGELKLMQKFCPSERNYSYFDIEEKTIRDNNFFFNPGHFHSIETRLKFLNEKDAKSAKK